MDPDSKRGRAYVFGTLDWGPDARPGNGPGTGSDQYAAMDDLGVGAFDRADCRHPEAHLWLLVWVPHEFPEWWCPQCEGMPGASSR